LNSERETRILK